MKYGRSTALRSALQISMSQKSDGTRRRASIWPEVQGAFLVTLLFSPVIGVSPETQIQNSETLNFSR